MAVHIRDFPDDRLRDYVIEESLWREAHHRHYLQMMKEAKERHARLEPVLAEDRRRRTMEAFGEEFAAQTWDATVDVSK